MGLTSDQVAGLVAKGFDLEASPAEKLADFRRSLGFNTVPSKVTPEQVEIWKQQDRQMRARAQKLIAQGKLVPADPEHFLQPDSQGPTPDQTMGDPAEAFFSGLRGEPPADR